MRIILSDHAKFYAVSDDEGGWTFKNDGHNYYLYPINSFEYGSKVVAYIKIEQDARVYKASGYRTWAEASVSMHKDNADDGEHIFEKCTALDREVQIFVDYFMPEEEGYEVEEGDYIEVDIVGLDEAAGLMLMNQSSPEPTPTPEPTIYDFQIITRGERTSIFATRPTAGEDYSEDYNLYAVGIRNSELYKFVDDGEGNWDTDSLFAEEYNKDTASAIKSAIPMADGDAYAWVAVEPKAESTPVDEEEPEEEA